MSFDGSGNYTVPAGTAAVSGTTIDSAKYNALLTDLQTALTKCLLRDGQSAALADISMGGFKLTSVAAATTRTGAANAGQVQDASTQLLTSVAGVDTITATLATPTLAAYALGQVFNFISAGANTGAVTLNVNGLGAKSVVKAGGTALAAGDIKSGGSVQVFYDGTKFQASGSGMTPATGYAAAGANTDITSLDGVHVGKGGGAIPTNTRYGEDALRDNTTGMENVGVGYLALKLNTTGGGNTAVGEQAMEQNTEGDRNVAVGTSALAAATDGFSNVAIGLGAMSSSGNGECNVALGSYALAHSGTGHINTALGYNALQYATGSGNVGIGAGAGTTFSTGSCNVEIGPSDSTGTYLPPFTVSTHSNRVVMGSTITTNAYIQVPWTVVSDARDKTNFAPVPHGLAFVNALQPVAYQFRESRDNVAPHGPVRYGFKAQDILALEGDSPVIVDNETPDKLRMVDQHLIAVLVKAVQELSAKVTALEARQ